MRAGSATIPGRRCTKLSPIESLLQYRFATPKPLKARPSPGGCRIACLCALSLGWGLRPLAPPRSRGVRSNWQAIGERHGDDQRVRRSHSIGLTWRSRSGSNGKSGAADPRKRSTARVDEETMRARAGEPAAATEKTEARPAGLAVRAAKCTGRALSGLLSFPIAAHPRPSFLTTQRATSNLKHISRLVHGPPSI